MTDRSSIMRSYFIVTLSEKEPDSIISYNILPVTTLRSQKESRVSLMYVKKMK